MKSPITFLIRKNIFYGGGKSLLHLFEQAAKGQNEKTQQLLVRQTVKNPLDLLQHHNYLEWKTIFNRIQVDQQLD
ncbi:MAG: hypothetical protein QM483_04200 [Desulfuromusa sp.]